MKYRLDRKDFEIYNNDFYLFPTIRIFIDNLIYAHRNFSIEFHFLVFHSRLLFMKDKGESYEDYKFGQRSR